MTALPLVLAANPLEWILNHIPQVLFILFFIAPTLGQIFKKQREAKRERERQLDHGPTEPTTATQPSVEARVPQPTPATGEDLEQRVRRYFEEITGQRQPELEPDDRDDEPEPTPQPQRQPERPQPAVRAEPAAAPQASHQVHSVFADMPKTVVKGEVEFDAHVHHGDVAPQVEVARRYAGASVSTRLLDLHDPWALRRAVVLREVLGPPLALREREDV